MKSNKYTVIIILLVFLVVVIYMLWQAKPQTTNTNTKTTDSTPTMQESESKTQGEIKEFTTTSFYELVDNKPKPQFSLSEIAVKKGDKVRIKVTNTKGAHDFKIDEFNVFAETPLDQEVVVEFTADKVGEFVYYCSQPNHRSLGQWGTLKVTE